MEYIKNIIERYKRVRSMRQLKQKYGGNYAFVGIGNHSTNNLYPVLNYLHVPLKYICSGIGWKCISLSRQDWSGMRHSCAFKKW